MRARILTTLAACGLALAPIATADAPNQLTQLGQAPGLAEPGDRNAALDYWRLINLLGEDRLDLVDRLAEVQGLMHSGTEEDATPVDEPASLAPGGALAQEFAGEQDLIEDIVRASREASCDFQIRYEDGYAALLPHLSPMRKLARLLVVDARRLALAGEHAAATERLAAMLRMARHLTGDRLLISSLVGVAIADMAMREASWLLDRTDGDKAARGILSAAMDRFPQDDPYNVKAALRLEQDLVASLARQFRGPDAGERFVAAYLDISGEWANEQLEPVRAMDGAQFKAEIERAVDAFDLVFAAWDAQDASAELERVSQRFVQGDFGPVASTVVPAFGKVWERDRDAREQLEHFRGRVRGNG